MNSPKPPGRRRHPLPDQPRVDEPNEASQPIEPTPRGGSAQTPGAVGAEPGVSRSMGKNASAALIARVKDLNNRWIAASLALDITFLSSFYSDDCIIHFQNGSTADKASLIDLLKSGDVAFQHITYSDERSVAYGDAVVWTARASMTETYRGTSTTGDYLWLRVFARRDGLVQAVAFQSTTVPVES